VILYIFKMKEKELPEDYLRDRLQVEIYNARQTFFDSCTMSTIRWLQRYLHCYSIVCSFFCLPLWILILPIAFAFDICICTTTLVIFIITFIIHFLFAPCMILYRFSSCSVAWNPVNIYRYSLREALAWAQTIYAMFGLMWMCYCGSGNTEGGAPIFCIYCCCKECHNACNQATHVNINDQTCTIL